MNAPKASKDRPLLLTGAGGFVGGYLLPALNARGVQTEHIVATTVLKETVKGARETLHLDLSDAVSIKNVIQGVQPGIIVHLAAIAVPSEARRNQDLAWKVNFEGTRHLAAATLSQVPDARFVFTGSAESYGATFNEVTGLVPETAALRPATAYGATKAAADIMLGQLANDGLDVVCTRSFNHTGPGQVPDYVVPAFAEQIARIEAGLQEPVLQVGNLDAARDFLDVRDVVRAYAAAALGPLAPGGLRAFNVCSGEARPIQSILDGLLALSDISIRVETDPDRLRPSDVPHAAGDNRALRKAFDWTPEITFEQTLRDTLDYFRASYNDN